MFYELFNRKICVFNCFALLVFILAIACSCSGGDRKVRANLSTRMDTISYIIGLDYGKSIRERGIDFNPEAIMAGLTDGLDSRSRLSDTLVGRIIEEYNRELQSLRESQAKEDVEKNKSAGRRFLEENRRQDGVIEIPGGLQYKILKKGTGPRPDPSDSVRIHYRAMFTDRKTFDMSYDRGPAAIRLTNVVKGLSEGICLMQQGAIFEFYIPPELGYGETNFAEIIPGGSTLIYSVELIEVVK